MKLFYGLLFFTLSLSLQAQTIRVLDSATREPIVGVAIYNTNKTKSTVTDIDGKASLDIFLKSERIYFQHLSYNNKQIKCSKIGIIVFLESSTQGLERIVISASKFKQHKRDIPQKIIGLNADAIALTNPQTSADLLANTGQVYVQKSQSGGGSPMIRGFSTNRLLITVDGVRMNNAIFRGGNIQNVVSIDPLSIANTEVILGAGSVIYGSDAVGGVMSFYTHEPKLSYTDSLRLTGKAMFRYATANQEKTANAKINFGLKKWGFLTNVSFSSFNDLKMGSHGSDDYLLTEYIETTNGIDNIVKNNNSKRQVNTAYNQINLMQKIRYIPKSNVTFDLGLFYTTTNDIPRYDRLILYENEQLKSAEWYYGPQQWFMGNLQFTKLSSSSSFYNKIKVTAAYQNFKESRISRDYQSQWRDTNKETVDAISLNFDFEKSLSTKTKLFYGAEYIHNAIGSTAKTKNIDTNKAEAIVTRYPDGATWQSVAAYTSLKYKPSNSFTFQSGLRYNQVYYNASFKDNNAFLNLPFNTAKGNTGALTGSAGVSWSPNTTMQWRLNASTAFRAPNIDDIGKVFDSEPGAVVVPNNNLKAEYAYGTELGLTLNFNTKLIVDLAAYYTYLDNALVRRNYTLNGESEILYNGQLSQVQAIQNASKSWINGFELGVQANLNKHLKLNTQLNIIKGTEEDETGEEVPVRHVSPIFGNTHVTYQKNKWLIDVFAVYNGKLSYSNLALSERSKAYLYTTDADGNPYAPSWYTLNTRVKYKLNSKLNVSASLENITDQRYRPYSSGISAAGINLIGAINYSF